MKKTIFAAAMALCLMAGSSAFAQSGKQGRMTKERPTAEQMAQHKTDRMKQQLNLTDEQTKLVYDHNLQQVNDMQTQREQMRDARKAEAEKMKGILTPEQYEKWEQSQSSEGHHRMRTAKDGKSCPQGQKCDKPARKDSK